MLQNNPRKSQPSSKSKSRLLLSLLLIVTLFTESCSTYPTTPKSDDLILSAIPDFPIAHPDVVKELKEVCPKDKCLKLHDWFTKLLVFKRQLVVLKKPTI